MSLPSANDVTNMYLYGQITTPEEKGGDEFIRVANSSLPPWGDPFGMLVHARSAFHGWR